MGENLNNQGSLKKALSPIGLWAIAVGLVVSGDYYGFAYGFAEGGPVSFLVSFIPVTLMYVPFLFCYTELATSIPHAGGPSAYARRAFGPFAGFVTGFSVLIAFLISPCAVALATGALVNYLIPSIPALAATVVFFIVLFSETIFECNIDPYNVPSCIFEFFSIIFKDSLGKIIPPLFKTEYQKAYSTDDPEDYMRKVFYNHLQFFISLCIPLCKHTIEEYDKLAIGEILDIPTITNNYSETNWLAEMDKYQAKIAKLQTPAIFVKNRGLQYGKSINDKHLEALLSGLNTSLEKTIGTTPIKEYLYSIVSNTISNGGAFRKNDINDALILCDLSSSDVILTFDRRMIEHMENHSTARAEYRNSISYIKSIWPYSN